MFASPTDSEEIDNIINNLCNKHSSGYDNISNHMLKWLHPVITKPLTIIFNLLIQHGIFPDCMKVAEIVPLHKGWDESLCNNYRPISLLITISKILEKIIYKRTYNFLEKKNILCQSQYGFRMKHSCTDAISELIGELTNKEAIRHYAELFLGISKYTIYLVEIILDYFAVVPSVCKYWGPCVKWARGGCLCLSHE